MIETGRERGIEREIGTEIEIETEREIETEKKREIGTEKKREIETERETGTRGGTKTKRRKNIRRGQDPDRGQGQRRRANTPFPVPTGDPAGPGKAPTKRCTQSSQWLAGRFYPSVQRFNLSRDLITEIV